MVIQKCVCVNARHFPVKALSTGHQGLGRVPGSLLTDLEVKNELLIFHVTGKDENCKKATQTIAMMRPAACWFWCPAFCIFSMKQHWEPVNAQLVPPPSLRSGAFRRDSPSCWLAALGLGETLGQAARLSARWPGTLSTTPG